MGLKIGEFAPDFTLYNTEKQSITLSSYRGQKVVLLFFPLAFTSTCTVELCGVRDDITSYSDLNAVVLALSVDTVFCLKKFKEEQNINFELLSDYNKNVCEAYGTLYDTFILEMKKVSKRCVFVIDELGLIQYIEILEVSKDLPQLDVVKKLLKNN